MIRAVIDTGVLVSALISSRGAPARLLLAWREGAFELVVSPHLLRELVRVLQRPKFAPYVTPEEAASYIAMFARDAIVVEDPQAPPGLTPDPGDDYLVALAREARVDVFVSGDVHLTGLPDPQPPVLSPRAFLNRLPRLPADLP